MSGPHLVSVISLKSIAVGLNPEAANHVVLMDLVSALVPPFRLTSLSAPELCLMNTFLQALAIHPVAVNHFKLMDGPGKCFVFACSHVAEQRPDDSIMNNTAAALSFSFVTANHVTLKHSKVFLIAVCC